MELDAEGDVAKLAQELAGREGVVKKHVHQALLGIVLAAVQKYVGFFRLCSEMGRTKAGLAFVLRGQPRRMRWNWSAAMCRRPRAILNLQLFEARSSTALSSSVPIINTLKLTV